MSYRDLRAFVCQLESQKLLKRIQVPVDPKFEITEICNRLLQQGGPAVLFENTKGHTIPILANLFGTVERIALALGLAPERSAQDSLRDLGKLLAFLKNPEPPENWQSLFKSWPFIKPLLSTPPTVIKNPPCQQVVLEQSKVDLFSFPIQTCWPEDAGPLITWGLVITKGPLQKRHNLGVYRLQVIAPNKIIVRWLSMRGGARDYKDWLTTHPDQPFPLAVAIGADPATLLAAVTPIPDQLSEYSFAGLLRKSRTEIAHSLSHDIQIPAHAEIVLEGHIMPREKAQEGPFGDHTGYYNEIETFPVMTVERVTHREKPFYHSTYTGRPPDEPAILSMALNEVFIPLLQKQFPEIVDFYLPPEGCSYRLAVVTIQKQYLGHAKRIMMGIWSFLKQFLYTKFILVTDDDINAREWKDVIWALTTRVDPSRDVVILENTPIDSLDFASPTPGLGAKMGIDATHKWPGETGRTWGRAIVQLPEVKQRIDDIWAKLGL